jgi:ATP-binding cassette subfamily B protein
MLDITTRQVWLYIIKMARPFRMSIVICLFVSVIHAIDLSFGPYLIKVILNRLNLSTQQGDIVSNIATPIIWYLCLELLITISYRLYNYFFSVKMIPELRKNIANEALALLIDKSYNFYQNILSGNLSNKINDLTKCVPVIIRIIFELSCIVLALTIAIIALWNVNISFALLMLGWTTSFICVWLFCSKKINTLARAWAECGSVITGKLVDVFSNILSVRLFAAKAREHSILNETCTNAANAEKKLEWAYFGIWLYYGISYLCLQGLNFYFLCKGIKEGWLTIGDFAMVLAINSSIVHFLWEVAINFSDFSKNFGQITQALKVLHTETEIIDKPFAIQLHSTNADIVFDNVSFHYKDTDKIFQNLCLTIPHAQKIGLVGYSGGGKSTLVNLILRLYDVTSGRIMISGQDVREVTQESLHKNIAMIPQDSSLFHRTIMDNIRYGFCDATDEEVFLAAKKAKAHDYIIKLPEGYQTLVGERGLKLSGGQRQRITIARAILKNAAILILDEATSSLDSITENDIQESFQHLMHDKTTIVIAHRLSTLLNMDRIIVLDQGKIVEDGSHDKLLLDGKLYKTLWDAQVGGFLPANIQ